jgi:hypothetical protein
MKSAAVRLFATLMVLVAITVLSGAAVKATRSAPVLEPDKLIVLSTTDVKGKTSPCG